MYVFSIFIDSDRLRIHWTYKFLEGPLDGTVNKLIYSPSTPRVVGQRCFVIWHKLNATFTEHMKSKILANVDYNCVKNRRIPAYSSRFWKTNGRQLGVLPFRTKKDLTWAKESDIRLVWSQKNWTLFFQYAILLS